MSLLTLDDAVEGESEDHEDAPDGGLGPGRAPLLLMLPLVLPDLLLGGGGPLVHSLPGDLPLPVGHLLHQGLCGGDGHPVAVVDGDVEELATAAWITEL